MVIKNQWISWSRCTSLPAKCQAVYGWAGTIRAAKVLETTSLSLVPQRVYGMSEVFLTSLHCDTGFLLKPPWGKASGDDTSAAHANTDIPR